MRIPEEYKDAREEPCSRYEFQIWQSCGTAPWHCLAASKERQIEIVRFFMLAGCVVVNNSENGRIKTNMEETRESNRVH